MQGFSKWLRPAAFCLLATALAGCASMRGSQEPLTASDLDRHPAICPDETQLEAAHNNENNGQYRDRIIMVCVKAITVKYRAFIDQLSFESGIANLGTDLIAQGLSTAASVVDGANLAKRLAAGSALSLGVGSTINKDLFYKQALPAIVASMEARRSKILTAIAKAQNEDRAGKIYTLDRAGYDLDMLEQAGSLTMAVRELTSIAVDNANQAEKERQLAERALDFGVVQQTTPAIDQRVKAVNTALRKLAADGKEAELRRIAAELGITPPPGLDPALIALSIRDEANATNFTQGEAAQEARLSKVEAAIARITGVMP